MFTFFLSLLAIYVLFRFSPAVVRVIIWFIKLVLGIKKSVDAKRRAEALKDGTVAYAKDAKSDYASLGERIKQAAAECNARTDAFIEQGMVDIKAEHAEEMAHLEDKYRTDVAELEA